VALSVRGSIIDLLEQGATMKCAARVSLACFRYDRQTRSVAAPAFMRGELGF
jgi:hypothetical protein